jgi:hypothetical protein
MQTPARGRRIAQGLLNRAIWADWMARRATLTRTTLGIKQILVSFTPPWIGDGVATETIGESTPGVDRPQFGRTGTFWVENLVPDGQGEFANRIRPILELVRLPGRRPRTPTPHPVPESKSRNRPITSRFETAGLAGDNSLYLGNRNGLAPMLPSRPRDLFTIG